MSAVAREEFGIYSVRVVEKKVEVRSLVVTLPNVGGMEVLSVGVKVSSIGMMVEDGTVAERRRGLGSGAVIDKRPSFLGFRRPRRMNFSLWRLKSGVFVSGGRCWGGCSSYVGRTWSLWKVEIMTAGLVRVVFSGLRETVTKMR